MTAAASRGLFPDDLLRTCISCGFCLSACPTYQDTRNEASSPRGRINLMRALEAGTLVEDDVREELSFCLGCRACEPVCPAGVKYGRCSSTAATRSGRLATRRLRGLLLAVGSPRRTRARRSHDAHGPAARTAPPCALARAARGGAKAAPTVASPSAWRVRRTVGPETGDPAALFLGCVGHVMFSGASHAACGTLATAGYCVTTPGEQGVLRRAARAQRRSRRCAQAGGLDGALRSPAARGPIVTTAGGCGAFMADYGLLLGTPEAEDFGARVRDYSTLLAGRALPALHGGDRLRVSYQDSCHLRNGQKVTLEPRALLASLPGVEVVDLPSAGRCCGAAGTYALMRPDDSLRFLDAEDGRDRGGGASTRSSTAIRAVPPAVPPGGAARAGSRTCVYCTRPSSWQSACSGSQ